MAQEPPASRPPPASTERAARDRQDSAFEALHAERSELERALTLAQQRQRFGANEVEIEQARLSEEALLKDLDRILTLIRAAEVRRKPGPGARRWQ